MEVALIDIRRLKKNSGCEVKIVSISMISSMSFLPVQFTY